MKISGVKAQMIFDERRNEVIAVVVAFLHAHLDRIARRLAGFLNQMRFELLLEKVIRRPLINQDGPLLCRLTQQ